jgi:hypothetical protein
MKHPILSPVLLLLSCACAAESGGDVTPPQEPATVAAAAELPEGVYLRLGPAQLVSGALPAGWEEAETNGAGRPATWSVRSAPGDGQALHVQTSNSGSTYNLLLSPDSLPADLELSVRVRADAGEEDQGGGLVWRARGADDYYVARWNPLERNLRVYKVEQGVRTLFQNADTQATPDGWHTVGVTMIGDRITVSLDGVVLLDTLDATFSTAGRVGLWTKADACTWFDALEAREPRWPEER